MTPSSSRSRRADGAAELVAERRPARTGRRSPPHHGRRTSVPIRHAAGWCRRGGRGRRDAARRWAARSPVRRRRRATTSRRRARGRRRRHDPDARRAARADDRALGRREDAAVLLADDVPVPEGDSVYELWAIRDGTPESTSPRSARRRRRGQRLRRRHSTRRAPRCGRSPRSRPAAASTRRAIRHPRVLTWHWPDPSSESRPVVGARVTRRRGRLRSCSHTSGVTQAWPGRAARRAASNSPRRPRWRRAGGWRCRRP